MAEGVAGVEAGVEGMGPVEMGSGPHGFGDNPDKSISKGQASGIDTDSIARKDTPSHTRSHTGDNTGGEGGTSSQALIQSIWTPLNMISTPDGLCIP